MRFFVGTASQRNASAKTGTAGDLAVETDTGNIAVADGTSLLGVLKRLVRVDEVTTAVQQYVTSLVVTNSNLTALANESGYTWALVDSAGRVSFGVKLDGTAVGKFSFAAASIALSMLGSDVTTLIPVAMPAESGYVWALADSNRRAAILVDATGLVTVPKLALPLGSVDTPQLSATLKAALPSALPAESGYVWSIDDSAGRLGIGLKPDGTFVAQKSSIVAYSMRAAENVNYLAHPFVDTSSRYQIRVTRRSDAAVMFVTSGSYNNVEPTLTEDDKLLFRSDSSGTMQGYWRKADGTGSTWLLIPTTDVYCPGDSLTFGSGAVGTSTRYPQILASTLGVTVVNDGIGGQTGAGIEARTNAAPYTTTASVTVPAGTTSVAVSTNISGSATANWSRTGTLAGIAGTLAWDTSAGFSFTRTTAGSSTVVPSGTPFLTDNGVAAQQNTLSIWLGRNSYTTDSPATTVARVQAILDYHKTYIKRFVVLEIPPRASTSGATDDETGAGTLPRGATRDALDATNAALLAAFPNNFVSVATYLRSNQAATDAAITYTTQDLVDIANGLTPTSFRSDTLHLNDTSYPLVGRFVAAFMQAKGWYS